MLKRTPAVDALLALPTAALSLSSFWRRGGDEPAGWTGPFSAAEYRAFLNVVGLYFGVRKLRIAVEGGELTVRTPSGEHREHLGGLAELCQRHERERWPALIAEHFRARFGGEAAAPATPGAQGGEAAMSAQPAEAAVSRDDRAAFRGMLEACFRRYGMAATVEPDAVVAREADGSERRFEAPGLERGPDELPRGEWARLVDGAFGEPLRALRGREALAGRGFGDVRDLLAVQLFDEEWLSVAACRDTVCTRDLPGLMSAVVCRLPQVTFRLSPETVAEWGRSADEVTEVALANLRHLRPAMQRFVVAPRVGGMRFETRGPFAAVQALTLAGDRECAQAYGALVAVPRRQLLLVCPLVPVRNAAKAYAAAAVGLATRILQSEWEGHTPLSTRLYWYRDGGFTALPYRAGAEGGGPAIELLDDDGFAAALAALEVGG